MAALMQHKYLVCFPRGGFNDMVQQIMQCILYCEAYNRLLVIDTVSTREFNDDINKYIDLTHSNIYDKPFSEFVSLVRSSTKSFYPEWNTCDNFDTLTYTFNSIHQNLVYNGIPAALDFSKSYKEDIVIHCACGGGTGAIQFLNMFPLTPLTICAFKKRWDSLSKPYLALHVRNTDYKSDIPIFIERVTPHIAEYENIFLATDNKDVIDQFKILFGNKIKSFSTINGIVGKTMHYTLPKIIQTYVLDIICDYLLLVVADEYYYSSTQSRYSKNAEQLRITPFRERLLAQLAAPTEST
jgi:hypothetical protein